MKAQQGLAVLATVSLLGLSVGCSSDNKYSEGFAKGKEEGYRLGYDEGYDDGYVDGDVAGFERAREYFASADYNTGFTDGQASGMQTGYNQGYADGTVNGYNSGYDDGHYDGSATGYTSGYNVGYDDGYSDGYDDGGLSTSGDYTAGYNAGFDDGYVSGENDGYVTGYDIGATDGYTVGWDDGYDVGWSDGYYGLSVGKSKTLRGYSNLLSMAHNDLIDYSKIKAPQKTARGLVANGRLLLSETSITNKDTLKRAAAVEQYLVVEMAKQVKGKFGLSAERSLKIAKAANHFRKYSSKRALTADDTNAYSEEIIGADLNSLEAAYVSSKKGDISGLQSVLEKAAEKNGTSPERMAEIVTTLFI